MPTPVILSLLSDVETPVSVFHKLSQDAPVGFLFESTESDSRLARYSFLGVDPIKTIAFQDGEARIEDCRTGDIQTQSVTNPLHSLAAFLAAEAAYFQDTPLLQQLNTPFTGGLVGYLGYGATRYFEGIPQQAADPFGVPEGFYGLYDTVVLFDHLYRRVFVVSYRGEAYAQSLLDKLMQPTPLTPLFYHPDMLAEDTIFDGVTGPLDAEAYCAVVRKAQTYIQEGQVFQIVPAHRFSLPVTSDPLNIYRLIQAINPSPYAYYLKYPGFTYIGSSPETFVQCHEGRVVLRALAGTRPRGASVQEDEALAAELRVNTKELAEHRMLVDLGRNDLGKVCHPGTVKTGEIATLIRYTHVMHLATEVSGQLRPDRTAFDVCQGCFPRGTVSGAPKVRAMQLLAELEPERRGIYSGVVGYFDHSGNMDGAIAIRSVLLKDGMAHVNAGAGVVYDSDPMAEYTETRNKAKSMIQAVQLAERMGVSHGRTHYHR